MRFYWIFSGMLIYLLIGCNINNKREQKDDTEVYVKKKYYPNGSIKSEYSVKSDTILHGSLKSFYLNGKMKRDIEYRDGIKNGIEKSYYETGQLKYEGKNVDGRADSIFVWYFENGQMKARDSWFNGKPFGENFKYYSTGKIQEYVFFDVNAEIKYKVEYDAFGNRIEESGNPLYVIYNSSLLTKNQTFESIIFVALPPDTKANVLIYEYDTLGVQLTEKILDKNKFDQYYYGLKYVYKSEINQPGEYFFKVILNTRDTTTKKEDSFDASVNFTIK